MATPNTPARRRAGTPLNVQRALMQASQVPVIPGQVTQVGAGAGALPPAPGGPVTAGYIGNTQPALAAGRPIAPAPPTTPALPSATPALSAASTPLQSAAAQSFGPTMAPAPTAPGMSAASGGGASTATNVASAAAQAARTSGPATAVPSPAMGMAAPAGRLGSLARTPFLMGSTTPYATGGMWGGRLASGSLGRAGLFGLGGQLAGGLWDRAVGEQDGRWDDAVGSALRWGGAGASVGSLFSPIGTAIGGGIGIGIGVTKGLLTGDDSPATELDRYLYGKTGQGGAKGDLGRLMDEYGISADTQQQLFMQLDILPQMEGMTKEQAQALVNETIATIPQLAIQDQQQQQMAARAASIQAALAPMMQQQLEMYNQAASGAAQSMRQAAGSISDPGVRAAYESAASNYLSASRQAGLGYLQQVAVAPYMAGMEQTEQYDRAYATALARAQAASDVEGGQSVANNATLFPAA